MNASKRAKTIKKAWTHLTAETVETMPTDEKMLTALKSSINHLNNSKSAAEKNDEDALENGVWHVAAELEYILFLLSIRFRDGIDKSRRKTDPKLQKMDVDSLLSTVHELLEASEKGLSKNNMQDAYGKISIARDYILKLQKEFDRKRREKWKKEK